MRTTRWLSSADFQNKSENIYWIEAAAAGGAEEPPKHTADSDWRQYNLWAPAGVSIGPATAKKLFDEKDQNSVSISPPIFFMWYSCANQQKEVLFHPYSNSHSLAKSRPAGNFKRSSAKTSSNQTLKNFFLNHVS